MNTISFDLAFSKYDKTRSFPIKIEEQIISSFIKHCPQIIDANVLDIGVGTGRFAIPLAKYAKTIVGVDISKEMLGVLGNKNQHSNLKTIQADARKLPLKYTYFDVILTVSTLHLISDYDSVLNEIEKLVKSQGLFVIGQTQYVGKNGLFYEDIRYKKLRQILPNTKEIGLTFDTQVKVLNSRWGEPREFNLAIWEKIFKPRDILNSFVNKIWSETWNLSDSELSSAIREIEEWIKTEGFTLNQKFKINACFKIYVYCIK
ncbi:MAG: class I SAM-dependent methyltransferase [Deltaproteobacteria bacterium]|nr:class I SAM-dependent methyltransferase [Deltaproteobacteria bacterium]